MRVSPVGVLEADDRYLTEVASTIDGVEVSTAIVVLEPGQQVASAILQAVDDAGPEATLCMTAHGRSGLGAAVLGSTTEDLLRNTDRPVLVVGRHCSGRWPGQQRLLVPLDGSEQATHVLPEVAGLATDWGLETWLLQIIHAFDTETAQHLDTALTGAQNRLRDLGVEAKTDYQFSSNAPAAIAEQARLVGTALIVMSSRVNPGAARTLLGSVTQGVIHHAPCPVLVCPPTS